MLVYEHMNMKKIRICSGLLTWLGSEVIGKERGAGEMGSQVKQKMREKTYYPAWMIRFCLCTYLISHAHACSFKETVELL